MIDAAVFFQMILYILGSILLVALIVLVIKLINTVNRVNNILDEVDKRVEKFDRIFRLADVVTDNMALVSDKVVDGISNLIRNVFYRKKGKEEDKNEK